MSLIEISSLDLFEFKNVNSLFPRFVNILGIDKSKKAFQDAFALQRMQGSKTTTPVLIFETCGLAFIKTEIIRKLTGMKFGDESIILMLSFKDKTLQVIREF